MTEQQPLKIFGAGMAGLLCAKVLGEYAPVVHEVAGTLPNNHKALLRFRTDEVSKATRIPFQQVRVRKGVFSHGKLQPFASIADENSYSAKVSSKVISRSIGNCDDCTRYIAPEDFIKRMARGIDIKFKSPLDSDLLCSCGPGTPPIISTIPMPIMMDIVGWQKPEFLWKSIRSIQWRINVPDTFVHQTVYFANPLNPIYRASITGNILILEYMEPVHIDEREYRQKAEDLLDEVFGIRDCQISLYNDKVQKFGKLLPIDDHIRREFIVHLSDKFSIYSLGRFATWRQLLLDDILNDISVIEKFITARGSYGRQIHQVK